MSEQNPRPPRETVIRANTMGLEFRAAGEVDEDIGSGYLGLLRIRFSPVNEWTEIQSRLEGHFLERFAPSAWKKTIRENIQRIRPLFQHGMDPQAGEKILGPFHRLEEDDDGGYAEVKLHDTSFNRDLLPGLREGLYGASHRFRAVRVHEESHPARSEHNPDGIPERTIKEAKLFELGPVTFPAYEGATSGVRSLTDEFLISAIRAHPDRVRSMFERAVDLEPPEDEPVPPTETATDPEPVIAEGDAPDGGTDDEQDAQQGEQDAPSTEDAAPPELGTAPRSSERRDTPAPKPGRPIYGMSRKETSKPWLLAPSKSTKRT